MNNTLYFERELGWTGIAVEPVPSSFAKLSEERTCHTINGCVSTHSGTETLIELVGQNMFSTLSKHNAGLTARRLNKRARRAKTEKREIEVQCHTLPELLEKFSINKIDFLKIDTEGGELEILKTLDFDKFAVSVIQVENNYFTSEIKNYLEGNGFVYKGTFSVDEIYVHKSIEAKTPL